MQTSEVAATSELTFEGKLCTRLDNSEKRHPETGTAGPRQIELKFESDLNPTDPSEKQNAAPTMVQSNAQARPPAHG